ncbi:flagellar basal-body rod protein FlgG [Natronobacillus azotifigens]|uniref:Flagellar hook-basal body protein n=1 Tax=Natronobacillus azotifigens TaxID=472978 RepID=A0A9J6RD75_9BACI|nr:flagellar hook-basal body protein [Natronobacillus azotifigens]MCZ0703674.1 flagellar hook-basal body protein [Natronobacillus azotifigens]
MSRMNIQAAVTMGQLQHKLDQIGHNIANVNTNGYKNRSSNFTSLLTQNINNFSDVEANATGRVTPHGIRLGSGAKLGHTNLDLSLGSLQQTGRGLDIALLADNHLLQVEVTENGVTETRYTRDGAMYLHPIADGQVMVTTRDGYPIVGESGPLVFADGMEDITISETGEILVTRNGVANVEGQLSMAQAIRPQFLESVGNNLLRLPDLTEVDYVAADIVGEVANGEIQVQNQALEQSNVDLSMQMTEMLQAQRSYQFNARTITMHDQMRGLVNQIR